MPELPDITVYIESLEARIGGAMLESIDLGNSFLLRTVEPAADDLYGSTVRSIKRIGKRIAIQLSNDHWMVIHLMIAGRLQWIDHGTKPNAKKYIAQFNFSSGTLRLTEAGTKRRASLHLFASEAHARSQDRGGIEVLDCDFNDFRQRLTLRNHTLKRALTDQSLFSGIGNAYSDEILHHAQLSPVALTQKLSAADIRKLHKSCVFILTHWTSRLREETGQEFPKKVTAFKEGMAVHGRFKQACPVCDTSIQRIRYASNETNYCPRCQTQGKLLADRSLSRLLKKDWPKTIEALENATHTEAALNAKNPDSS